MSPPVLVSAFIGSKNLGDEAIFRAIVENLDIDKDALCVLTIDKHRTETRARVAVRDARSPTDLIRSMVTCKVVLLGGGGIIQDESSVLNFLYFASQILVARLFRRPVILCFVGVGPIRSRVSKVIARFLLPAVRCSIVRDEQSKRELLALGVKDSAVCVAHDAALNLDPVKPKAPPRFHRDQPYVLVSIRRWFYRKAMLPSAISRSLQEAGFGNKKFESFVQALAREFDTFLERNRKFRLTFVSFFDPDDDAVGRAVIERMKHGQRADLEASPLTEDRYLTLAAGSEFVVGMRLHSLILAAVAGRPFVALGYSTKVTQFSKQLRLDDFHIGVTHISHGDLARLMASMAREADSRAPEVAERVRHFRARNREVFETLSEDLRNLSGAHRRSAAPKNVV